MARHAAKRSLLDTLGVAAGGYGTQLSQIIRDHAAEDMSGHAPMLLDSRTASLSGAAMAAGLMIDSLDGHALPRVISAHHCCPGCLDLATNTASRDRAF